MLTFKRVGTGSIFIFKEIFLIGDLLISWAIYLKLYFLISVLKCYRLVRLTKQYFFIRLAHFYRQK